MTLLVLAPLHLASPGALAQVVAHEPVDRDAAPEQAGLANTFEATFFEKFAPRNALDMVLRVPGFGLKSGNADVRGFAQAAGNVVINGKRPSSKSDGLVAILERIPASRVARIEVGPGAQFGSDYSGEVQVANVILSATDGLSGNARLALERNFAGRVAASSEASANWVRGSHSIALAGTYQNGPYDERGFDRRVAAGSGALLFERNRAVAIEEPKYSAALTYGYDGNRPDTAHFNLKRSRTGSDYREDRTQTGPSGVRRDLLLSDYRTDEFEIGGDATLKLLGGSFGLVALHTRRDRRFEDLFSFNIKGGRLDGFAQLLDDRRRETIGRVTYARKVASHVDLELGVEAARNILNSTVELTDLASQQRIDLPVDDATVREDRIEAYATASFPLTKRLRAESGVRYEYSKLTVTGDADAERRLGFLKPTMSLFWDAGKSLSVQFSVERTVAQLQFEEFISFAELKDDQINGGNADLRPQRAWEVKLTGETVLLGDGLARVTLEYDRISQVQDRVPVPGGFDAPGNLGTGQLWAVDATLELPLAKLGLEGARLSAQSSIILTSVRDPYTAVLRRFSGVPLASVNIGFRKDSKAFAWGFDFSASGLATTFRLGELDTTLGQASSWSAFYQLRPDKRSTLTFSVANLLNSSTKRKRTFFDPDRSSPTPVEIETRTTRRHVTPRVSYKRSF
jgi:hypothetical protein